jgi:hypothetical protein
MKEIDPLISCKVNVSCLKSSNPREIIPTHVHSLAEKMKFEIKDRLNPLILCIKPEEVHSALQALESGSPFACKIVVFSFVELSVFFFIFQNGHHRVLALKQAFPKEPPLFYSHVYVHNLNSHKYLKQLSYNDDDDSVPDFISAKFDRLKTRFDQYFIYILII